MSINEFLKPANGEKYPRGGYRGGKGGRGPRGEGNQRHGGAASPVIEGGRGGRGGAVDGGNQRYRGPAAPAIEDTAQFPTLGK